MSAPLPFAPMPLAVLDEPFDHGGFIVELKYDGFPALADVASGPSMVSRSCRISTVCHGAFYCIVYCTVIRAPGGVVAP
jgi:hypothetical protein